MRSIGYDKHINLNQPHQGEPLWLTIDINHHTITAIEWQWHNVKHKLTKKTLAPYNYFMLQPGCSLWDKLSTYHIDKRYCRLFHMKHTKHHKMECFLYGYASYLVLIGLLHNKSFCQQLPFSFFVPCKLEDGDCHFYDVLQYMLLPLKAMIPLVKRDTRWLYHLFRVVVKWIDTWLGLFPVGPALQPSLIIKLHADIIQGVTACMKKSQSSSDEDFDIKKPKHVSSSSTSLSSSTSTSSSSENKQGQLIYPLAEQSETSMSSFVQQGVKFHLPREVTEDTDATSMSSVSVLNNKIAFHGLSQSCESVNDNLIFYHSMSTLPSSSASLTSVESMSTLSSIESNTYQPPLIRYHDTVSSTPDQRIYYHSDTDLVWSS